jgi:hypothetical protein
LDLNDNLYQNGGKGMRRATRVQMEEAGFSPSEQEVLEEMNAGRAEERAQVSSVRFRKDGIEGAIVVRANEVAHYFDALPALTNVADIAAAAPLVPPYPKLFIEFEGVPNEVGFSSWGVLVESTREPTEPLYREGSYWFVGMALFGEWRKGDVVGPVLTLPLLARSEGLSNHS